MEFPVKIVSFGSVFAFEITQQRFSIGFVSGGLSGAAHLNKRGHQIPERPWLIVDTAGWYCTGPPGKRGLSERAFVHASLVSTQTVAGLIEQFSDV